MRFLLALVFLLFCSVSFAQDRCDWKITDVVQDQLRGSIVVKSEYSIDGYVVYNGETRYDEQSGSDRHVLNMIKNDLNEQCYFLLKTPKIADDFYRKPGLIKKKKDTQAMLKNLSRLRGKKGTVLK